MSFDTNTHRPTLVGGASSELSRFLIGLALVLAGTAVIAISAKIKVPFFPVPMTLQTLAIMAIAATYGSRLAVVTVLAYLVEGLVGLPVFTNTPPAGAGPAYFLGPTGGFLAGFVAMAAIVGIAADRGFGRSTVKLAGALLAGEVVMMALGFAWLAWFATLSSGATGLGAGTALAAGVTPFVLGDLLKIALVALGVPAIWSLFGRKG
ncbi:MAG TPA: biotin transporter BioY [Bauldia sp.]|nr:biotin transporter BioY [Bauldia sp.]